jgi:hypothetical protein
VIASSTKGLRAVLQKESELVTLDEPALSLFSLTTRASARIDIPFTQPLRLTERDEPLDSDTGTRHQEELAELSRQGFQVRACVECECVKSHHANSCTL